MSHVTRTQCQSACRDTAPPHGHGLGGAPPLLPAVSASNSSAPTSNKKLLQMLLCTPTISPLVIPLR